MNDKRRWDLNRRRLAFVTLFQAQFSDDGGTIVAAFSSEGSASSGLLDADDPGSGSGPGSCHTVLNASSIPPLGQDASCECAVRCNYLKNGAGTSHKLL